MNAGAGSGLRLAYLTSRYPAISHTFIQREIQALRRLGASIETISLHPARSEDLFGEEDREEAAATLSIRSLPRWKIAAAHLDAFGRGPRAYLATLRFSAGAASNGRVLSPLFHFAEAVVVWSLCRRRGVRHVHAHFTSPAADVAQLAAHLGEGVSPGGGISWSFTAHGTDIPNDSPRRLAEKVRRAPLVVCVSHAGRAQLMRMVEEEHWGKVRVVRCGLDARWRESFDRGEAITVGAGGPLRILSVGRLEREKGHSILLEAIAELRHRGTPVELVVVGGGTACGRLVERARELGLGGEVAFVGAVGGEQLRARYADADLFCLPSLGEGVPVVLMEAMTAGLAVVATRVGGVSELVEDGVSGKLVSPGDAGALASAIETLATDPAGRKRMGEAGRARVLADFDVEQGASLLFEEFSRLAEARA
jgi:colanic acid/amylovoran biosynthesis glycosyltransferase